MISSNIVLLTSNFPPSGGGISHYLYEIVRHLPRTQTRVLSLPTPGWREFDRRQAFEVLRVPIPQGWDTSSPYFKFAAPFYLSSLAAQKNNLDMVLCGHAHHSLMMPAWIMRRIRGIRYGVFTYGLDILRHQSRIYHPLFNHLLRCADVVFAISQNTSELLYKLGIEPSKVYIVHPVINSELFMNGASPDVIRKQHGLVGKKCILSVGRLVERKGFDKVIRALPLILNAEPEVHYVIVGRGSAESSLKALIHDVEVEEHVTLAGFVPDKQLPNYYAASNVFAMISRKVPERGDIEGFGIVYLEANMMGIPVVGGDSGGVSDAVVHEKTGLLVNPYDTEEVASAILRLLQNPEYAKRLGRTGRERVLNQFTGSKAAENVLSAIASIEQ